MLKTLECLNDEQLNPAKEVNGAILVTAGAGSGKTRVLIQRIAHLIIDEKVDPYNILAITFTNKAANELKERVSNYEPKLDGLWISTFHSMCARILRKHINCLDGFDKNFTIYDSSDSKTLLKNVVKSLNFEASDVDCYFNEISKAKNDGLDYNEYLKKYNSKSNSNQTYEVYKEYQNELKNNNALDFDDLLLKTLEVFNKFPNILNEYQRRFKYIHIDEFQDTNLVQYKIVKLLADYHKNIFIVGDEDQCIYGWRGANIENIINFRKDFNNVKCFKLQQNYRSTKNILKVANKLIKNNTTRIDKSLWTLNEDGEYPILHRSEDENAEVEYISHIINNLLNRGIQPKDISILLRVSSISRLIEEKLLSYNIPYKVSGIFKFFERAEVKNVLAYLQLTINEKDNQSLKRIINFPKRKIGEVSIAKIEEVAIKNNISMLEVVKNAKDFNLGNTLIEKLKPLTDLYNNLNYNSSLSEFAEDIIRKTDIKMAYNKNDEDDLDRLRNIDQLMLSIKNFENLNPELSLSDYLQSVTLTSSIEENNDDNNSVSISTIHAAKGLEFDYVFIMGAEEGLFPVNRAIDDEKQMEEERRLMYVALTRAKKQVYITYAFSRYLFGHREQSVPSRFLKEMGLIKEVERPIYSSYNNYNSYSHNNNYSMNNYTKNSYYNSVSDNVNKGYITSEKVSTNLQDLMVKKLQKQKNNYSNYQVGVQVLHPKFGIGIIVNADTDSQNPSVSVNFSGFGVKTLSLTIAPLQILPKK